MTIEELSTIVMGELSYVNFGLVILTLVLVATVIFMVWKFNRLNERIAKLESESRRIQRKLK